MDHAARWVFSVSWQAGALILLVLLLRRALGHRLTPGWRCALWLLVGIRLLTPGLIHLPAPTNTRTADPTPPPTPATTAGPTITVTRFWNGLQPPPSPTTGHPTPEPPARNWPNLLPWIWAAGAAVMLGRLAISNLRLALRVRKMPPVTDAETLRLAHACAAEMGVKREPKIVETADVRSPAIWGALRPVIMLPAGCRLTGDDLRMVLLHETAHIRHHDLRVEWLSGLLTAIHWFNPLVWLAAAASRADRELACDAAVLRRLGPDRQRDYGACLLRLVQTVAGLPPEPAAIGAFGNKRNLHRRINMIATYRGKRSTAAWAAGAMVFAAVACCAATGAGSDADKKPAPAPNAGNVTAVQKPAATTPPADAAPSVLEKRMAEVRFDERPFNEVVESLRETTGVNIFVNWRALAAAGIERNTPVTARLRDVRFGKALETILHGVGGGAVRLAYTSDDGVIMISTAEDLSRNTITRVYDIRDLIVGVPDFVGFNLGTAATRPTSEPVQMTRQERVTQITSFLQEVVDPDSWRDNGGLIGSIRELNGHLIVAQTPENQAEVARVLATLRESQGLQITVAARYVFVDQKTLDEMGIDWASDSAGKGVGTFVTDEQVKAFLKAAQKSKESTIVTSPRVTLFNGQRALVAVNTSTAYVKDVVVVQTKAGETRYEPRMGEVQTGLTLDLQGTLSADRKSVTLSIQSVLSSLKEMKSRPLDAGAEGMRVQVPDVTTRTTQTSASIPDGQTLMLVAMTPEAADPQAGKPNGQTFIFLTPTVILPPDTTTPSSPISSSPTK